MGEKDLNSSYGTLDYIRFRLRRFGISMIVLAFCLILYYLGFFGNHEGPLNPGRLGQALDARGMDKHHTACLFIALFFLLLTWNWVFNMVSLIRGKRLVCLAADREGVLCGARVYRESYADPEGNKRLCYRCEKGHVSSSARFMPIRKGPWSYCICLAAAFISGMCIYWI